MPQISNGALSDSVPAAEAGAAPAPAPPPRRGKIEVAPQAIATIAGRAVAECYGVVGIAARRSHRPGLVELLPPEQYSRGVEVRFNAGRLMIDVHVVIEHGLRISEIAHNIMEGVKFAVERALSLPVAAVNVNVQALRVTPDG